VNAKVSRARSERRLKRLGIDLNFLQQGDTPDLLMPRVQRGRKSGPEIPLLEIPLLCAGRWGILGFPEGQTLFALFFWGTGWIALFMDRCSSRERRLQGGVTPEDAFRAYVAKGYMPLPVDV